MLFALAAAGLLAPVLGDVPPPRLYPAKIASLTRMILPLFNTSCPAHWAVQQTGVRFALSVRARAAGTYLYGFGKAGDWSCGKRLFWQHLCAQGATPTTSARKADLTLCMVNHADKECQAPAPGQLTNANVDGLSFALSKLDVALAADAWARQHGCDPDSLVPSTGVLSLRGGQDEGRDVTALCAMLARHSAQTEFVVKEASMDLGTGLWFTNRSRLLAALGEFCHGSGQSGSSSRSSSVILDASMLERLAARLASAALFNPSRFEKRQSAFESKPKHVLPSLLFQLVVQPLLTIGDRAISSRDYTLLMRYGEESAALFHQGYIMRCVSVGCRSTNTKSETADFKVDADWEPYRFLRPRLLSLVPAPVAERIRATHAAAIGTMVRATAERLPSKGFSRGETPARGLLPLRWALIGSDAVFDAAGNARVLELNWFPELFCRRREGAARRENNEALVGVVVRMLL